MNQFYEWNYDYPKLVWESGFQFSTPKPQQFRKLIEHNPLSFMDVDRIVNERDICTVDKHIDTVINYNIDPADVIVLDKGFVKIFRLSQLAIEYLLCCKRHLDTNVTMLKNELIKFQEENERLREDKMINESKVIEFRRKIKDLKKVINVYSKNNGHALKDIHNNYQCSACSKIFENEQKLESHKDRHHKDFVEGDKILEENGKEVDDSALFRLQNEVQALKNLIENKFLDDNDEQKVLDALDAAIDDRSYEQKFTQTDPETIVATRHFGTQCGQDSKNEFKDTDDIVRLESHLEEIMTKIHILEESVQQNDEKSIAPPTFPLEILNEQNSLQNCTEKDAVVKIKKSKSAKTKTIDKENAEAATNRIKDLLNKQLMNFGIDPHSNSISTTVLQTKIQFMDDNRQFAFKNMSEYRNIKDKLMENIDNMANNRNGACGEGGAIYKLTAFNDSNRSRKKVLFEDSL